jgi:hypothetical protein
MSHERRGRHPRTDRQLSVHDVAAAATSESRVETDADTVLTPAEVAARLKVDHRTVRRMFLNEPGVLVICFPRKGRRLYRTLRIPLDVFQRVVTRLANVA